MKNIKCSGTIILYKRNLKIYLNILCFFKYPADFQTCIHIDNIIPWIYLYGTGNKNEFNSENIFFHFESFLSLCFAVFTVILCVMVGLFTPSCLLAFLVLLLLLLPRIWTFWTHLNIKIETRKKTWKRERGKGWFISLAIFHTLIFNLVVTTDVPRELIRFTFLSFRFLWLLHTDRERTTKFLCNSTQTNQQQSNFYLWSFLQLSNEMILMMSSATLFANTYHIPYLYMEKIRTQNTNVYLPPCHNSKLVFSHKGLVWWWKTSAKR